MNNLQDPFSPENAPKLALVVQMRIYDALMCILNELNPEVGAQLDEIHGMGKILCNLPYIDLTNED